jgi:hypothetical protein
MNTPDSLIFDMDGIGNTDRFCVETQFVFGVCGIFMRAGLFLISANAVL